jgi:flagellar hook-basal body complex protein FliE
MAIPAIGVLPPIMPTAPIGGASSVGSAGSAAASGTGGAGFDKALTSVVDQLTTVHKNADTLAVQAADGTLKNPTDYLLAANEASLTTQMTVAVRNKALEAFNEIMRMPL